MEKCSFVIVRHWSWRRKRFKVKLSDNRLASPIRWLFRLGFRLFLKIKIKQKCWTNDLIGAGLISKYMWDENKTEWRSIRFLFLWNCVVNNPVGEMINCPESFCRNLVEHEADYNWCCKIEPKFEQINLV